MIAVCSVLSCRYYAFLYCLNGTTYMNWRAFGPFRSPTAAGTVWEAFVQAQEGSHESDAGISLLFAMVSCWISATACWWCVNEFELVWLLWHIYEVNRSHVLIWRRSCRTMWILLCGIKKNEVSTIFFYQHIPSGSKKNALKNQSTS